MTGEVDRLVKICALIPAYNEERHVAEVVRGCLEHGLTVVVVDDCSTDATIERARAAGAEVARHDVNLGKGAALGTGLAWARERGFDAAITLDGDGQHDPAEIPRFIDCARRRGADIVVGSRFLRRTGRTAIFETALGPQLKSAERAVARGRSYRRRAFEGRAPKTGDDTMPPLRRLTNWFMSMILSYAARARLTDSQSGYRLIRTSAWEKLDLVTSGFATESEMLVRACRSGLKVAEVPIRTIYGDEVSSIHAGRDTLRWAKLLWGLWRRARARRRRRLRGLAK